MQKRFTDMTGRTLVLDFPPKRIVSLVPSQTELLADLRLDEEVVGITKFCVHPDDWFRSKTRIGGTKKLHIDKIKELRPDLILANKEENEKAQVEELAAHFPVWISDIKTIEGALNMIAEVGGLADRAEEATGIAEDIRKAFARLRGDASGKKVAYFIWYNPWMSVGGDTFISSMIETMGWENVFKDQTRYPEVTPAGLIKAAPELVLLSSEPYPFKEEHAVQIRRILPEAEVRLVDGEMFSWYGSRMLKAASYLTELRSV